MIPFDISALKQASEAMEKNIQSAQIALAMAMKNATNEQKDKIKEINRNFAESLGKIEEMKKKGKSWR